MLGFPPSELENSITDAIWEGSARPAEHAMHLHLPLASPEDTSDLLPCAEQVTRRCYGRVPNHNADRSVIPRYLDPDR